MLKEILREIEDSGGPMTVKELARRLEVEESALRGMLDYLERKGRLSVYDPESDECGPVSCESCIFSRGCEVAEKGASTDGS